jgi:(1->4)-alpha-D-glucan 1-alpha-D-glucosylmutase
MQFIISVLKDEKFLAGFIPFVKKIMNYAAEAALVQTVLKTAAPGIPDFYQGCELWNLSYVDPDNRRLVDYSIRKELLAAIIHKADRQDDLWKYLESNKNKGAEKMFVLWKMLQLRKQYPGLFLHGKYTAIPVTATSKEPVLAFERSWENRSILVLAMLGIKNEKESNVWKIKLHHPEGLHKRWKNIFTDELLEIKEDTINASWLAKCPVAVFLPEPTNGCKMPDA